MCIKSEIDEICLNLLQLAIVMRPSCWHKNFGPNGLSTPAQWLCLNFFSSLNADFDISSALRWAIQDQWSSGFSCCYHVIHISCNKTLLWAQNALILRMKHNERPYAKLLWSLFNLWAYFGCWWNTLQITSFRAIFLLFVYILKFVCFLLENEYGRFKLLRHTV